MTTTTNKTLKTVKIPDHIAEILRNSTFTETTMTLPEKRLDPKIYKEVMKVIEAVGGKWNRSKQCHLFERDPRATVEAALGGAGEVVDVKKTTQAFYTPTRIAQELVSEAAILDNHDILEPSAGEGALLAALWPPGSYPAGVRREGHLGRLMAVEIDSVSAGKLIMNFPNFLQVVCQDFLEIQPGPGYDSFDRVLMNPPFTKGQDIAHVQHAFKFLKRGGWLLAIMAPGWLFSSAKKAKAFRDFFDQNGGEVLKEYNNHEFRSSGTDVSTCLIRLIKP